MTRIKHTRHIACATALSSSSSAYFQIRRTDFKTLPKDHRATSALSGKLYDFSPDGHGVSGGSFNFRPRLKPYHHGGRQSAQYHDIRPKPHDVKGRSLKQVPIFVIVAALAVSVAGATTFSATGADDESSLIFGGKIPPGYRDWRLISVAHEEGNLNDIRAVLGNDIAIKAYRDGKLPFPDGAIIARLAWSYAPSEENDKAFGRPQSFVAGAPTNVQFMVRNSREYASTGGWGFAQFSDGKPARVVVRDCFSCHVPAKARDFVFTRYSP
jgi:hypothetical protein